MHREIWLKNYPAGVSVEINPNAFPSLVAVFEHSFAKYKDLPALKNMGVEMTFGQLDELSRNFAAYLQNETSLKKGDRFAVLCPNLMQYPVALVGVLRAGLILVGTNPLYTAREMEYQLKDCGAKGMMILSNFVPVLEKIIQNTQVETIIVTQPTDALVPENAPLNTNESYNLPDFLSYREALTKGKKCTYKAVEIHNSDVAFLQYTGGTTGLSKGAMISHRNMIANLEQFRAWMKPLNLQEGKETIINAMPLYHAYSLVAIFAKALLDGHKQLLITNPRDMKGFAHELAKNKFSVLSAVNTIFNGLLNEPETQNIDFSSLKFCGSGGMPVQKSMIDKWKALTGVLVVEAFGLSECTCVAVANPMDGSARIGTCGIPVPSTEVKLIDEADNEVEIGKPGEICIKGPQVMAGYWQKPEETALVLKDGWLKTGDIGLMNEEGFISIVDRKKDMIIVSGFNVFPNEIEQIVNMHPGVMESACIGVADEKCGEAVKIFVVSKYQNLTTESILVHCRENLTAYKVPKHIEFVDEIPKSNVGKLLRRILKDKELTKI